MRIVNGALVQFTPIFNYSSKINNLFKGVSGEEFKTQYGNILSNNKLDKLQDSGTVKIGKNLNHPYFYISDYSEKEILSQFSWKIPLQIFGGSIAAIISFYFFVNYAIQYRLF